MVGPAPLPRFAVSRVIRGPVYLTGGLIEFHALELVRDILAHAPRGALENGLELRVEAIPAGYVDDPNPPEIPDRSPAPRVPVKGRTAAEFAADVERSDSEGVVAVLCSAVWSLLLAQEGRDR
jgi:hypothetical protein